MFIRKDKEIMYWLMVIIIVFAVFMNVSIKNTYASGENRTVYYMPDEMSAKVVETMEGFDMREVKIYGHILEVYTNQDKEIILVKGNVTDWYESKRIEEYFMLRAPSTYQLIFSINYMQ
ncbi:MAG: hypothetical protein ACMUJM_02210 [bacterium]